MSWPSAPARSSRRSSAAGFSVRSRTRGNDPDADGRAGVRGRAGLQRHTRLRDHGCGDRRASIGCSRAPRDWGDGIRRRAGHRAAHWRKLQSRAITWAGAGLGELDGALALLGCADRRDDWGDAAVRVSAPCERSAARAQRSPLASRVRSERGVARQQRYPQIQMNIH